MRAPAIVEWSWHTAAQEPPVNALALVRRGVHHGFVRRRRIVVSARPEELWRRGEAIHLRRALSAGVRSYAREIAASTRLFDRLRSGGEFGAELWARLEERPSILPAGSSVDLGDPREIEKVHADLRNHSTDLYAKLSWVSADPEDESLRIRFSFGSERLDDWHKDRRRSQAADRFAELAFPEIRVLGKDRALARLLEKCCGSRIRMSERIVYSNAPGGGAHFHHDLEVNQLGVAYAQLQGATAWLALPKWRLAEFSAPLDLERPDARLDRWLNSAPKLTRRLAEAGLLYVMRAGDVLLLPSPSGDLAAWHSVFAMGKRPSLSLSFGLFASTESE